MTSRRAASSLGCLFTLLIVAAVIYFGSSIVEVYWRAYQYQDDMREQATFAAHLSNAAILTQLRAVADSLDLPDEATIISIKRTPTTISIEAFYDEPIELPMTVRELHFHPHAEGPL